MGYTNMDFGFEVSNNKEKLQLNQSYNNIVLLGKFPMRLFSVGYPISAKEKNALENFCKTKKIIMITPSFTADKSYSAIVRVSLDSRNVTPFIDELGYCLFLINHKEKSLFLPTYEKMKEFGLSKKYLYFWGIKDNNQVNKSTFGLQIYDSNGVVIFDSNKKYMRVLNYSAQITDHPQPVDISPWLNDKYKLSVLDITLPLPISCMLEVALASYPYLENPMRPNLQIDALDLKNGELVFNTYSDLNNQKLLPYEYAQLPPDVYYSAMGSMLAYNAGFLIIDVTNL